VDPREQLAGHLAFLTDLGIDGVSRDRYWRDPGGSAESAGPGLRPAQSPVSAVGRGAPAVGQGVPPPPAEPTPAGYDGPAEAQGAKAGSPAQSLQVIRTDLGDCTRCKLHTLGRRQIVFGVGNPNASLMFIGEAPGRDEDVQGIPFVGRAGQLLTRMIEAIGFTRDDVYIANVIKCRPPENRNPEPDEVATCEPFLFRQVEAIGPAVIVALGTFAAQALLKTQESISRLRGRVYMYGGAQLIPTFHPAYLLRSPERKRDAWEDLKKAQALLKAASPDAPGHKT
jgi:uracil-DNA glycosylase family 4